MHASAQRKSLRPAPLHSFILQNEFQHCDERPGLGLARQVQSHTGTETRRVMPNPVDASTQGVKKKKKFWSDGQKRPKQVRHEERSHGKMKHSFGRTGAEGQKGRVLRMRRKYYICQRAQRAAACMME
jgi:hypothetical protein